MVKKFVYILTLSNNLFGNLSYIIEFIDEVGITLVKEKVLSPEILVERLGYFVL